MVAYLVVAEKVPACQPAYHVFVVLALEAFLVVMWLATFAAVAARRARFVVDVTVEGCYNNGGLFSSKSCFVKRAVILFQRGRDMMSAAAGMGAIIWYVSPGWRCSSAPSCRRGSTRRQDPLHRQLCLETCPLPEGAQAGTLRSERRKRQRSGEGPRGSQD